MKYDYLIVGANGSEKWITGNYGSKIKKAEEMIKNATEMTPTLQGYGNIVKDYADVEI